ncbi:MAG: DUF1292 domain-containing protein [Eubacterium sp.]|nr:DUF1292 domain-containing protein [Eubacterium sp.]
MAVKDQIGEMLEIEKDDDVVRCELLDCIHYDSHNYAILLPAESDEEDVSFIIRRIVDDELEEVEDDDLLETLNEIAYNDYGDTLGI